MALDAADERQSPWVSESVRRRQGVQPERAASTVVANWVRGRITGRCSAPVQWKRGHAASGKEGCMSKWARQGTACARACGGSLEMSPWLQRGPMLTLHPDVEVRSAWDSPVRCCA